MLSLALACCSLGCLAALALLRLRLWLAALLACCLAGLLARLVGFALPCAFLGLLSLLAGLIARFLAL